ncbi:TetR/AcrR family transcriptional regulator [Enterococcus gallinarum]|nr:TetR/AcrR family transcriptional regulator [Enterococcus gallinarum]
MTTAKIAKNAGVSPATIYLYYQDKTDLLSRLYEEVKTNLHDGLEKVINKDSSLDEQIQQMIFLQWNNIERILKKHIL